MRFVSFTVAAALAMPAVAAAPKLNAAQQLQIQQASERGKLLYAYDQAAWHGTDRFLEQSPELVKRSNGWVVTGSADAPELAFYDAGGRAIYRVHFAAGQITSAEVVEGTQEAQLTPIERQMIAAWNKGLAAFQADKSQLCSKSDPNYATLPPSTPGGPILVYLLTSQTDAKSLPFGGHHMVEVDADGKTGRVRHFTKSCFAMPLPTAGDKVAALGITHLLDPVPTEIHVFSSLQAKLPVIVMTSAGNWEVNGAKITLLNKR